METCTDSRFRCIMIHPIVTIAYNQLLSMTRDGGGIHIPHPSAVDVESTGCGSELGCLIQFDLALMYYGALLNHKEHLQTPQRDI